MNKKTWIEISIILLIVGFTVFLNLGRLPLLDPDEPVYAETAREMIITDDFISPRIYGDFWYDKPPMYYWLTALTFKVFGQNEFAARFPSAVLSLCCVLFVYFYSKRLFNNRAAVMSALVLATSIEYLYLSKAAVTDITLTFFMTIALLTYLRKQYYFFYIGTAFAVVTKGPIGIVLPAGIVFIHLLVARKLSTLRNMKLISGSITFLVIALPWYLAMYYYHGTDFINTFLGFHNVTRFLQPEHPEGKLWYYYIPVLLVGFFPWIGFLGQACYGIWQERKKLYGDVLIFLFLWVVTVFTFFTLSQTKLVSYILPMYPPLAIIVGWYIDKIMTEKRQDAFKKTAVLITFFTIMFEIALIIAGGKIQNDLMPGIGANGIVFTVMLCGVWVSIWRKKYQDFVVSLVISMIGFAIILMTVLLPAIAPVFSVKQFVPDFKEQYDGQANVYVAKFYRPGFAFYTGIYGQEFKNNEQIEQVILHDKGKTFIFMSNKSYQDLSSSIKEKLQIKANKDGKVLLLKEAD